MRIVKLRKFDTTIEKILQPVTELSPYLRFLVFQAMIEEEKLEKLQSDLKQTPLEVQRSIIKIVKNMHELLPPPSQRSSPWLVKKGNVTRAKNTLRFQILKKPSLTNLISKKNFMEKLRYLIITYREKSKKVLQKDFLDACAKGPLEQVEALYPHVDLNICDEEGQFPLHIAIKNINIPVILFLAEKGVNVDKLNRAGQSAGDLAFLYLYNQADLVTYMREVELIEQALYKLYPNISLQSILLKAREQLATHCLENKVGIAWFFKRGISSKQGMEAIMGWLDKILGGLLESQWKNICTPLVVQYMSEIKQIFEQQSVVTSTPLNLTSLPAAPLPADKGKVTAVEEGAQPLSPLLIFSKRKRAHEAANTPTPYTRDERISISSLTQNSTAYLSSQVPSIGTTKKQKIAHPS